MSTMNGKNHSFRLMEPATPESLIPDAGISLWWPVAGGAVLMGIILLWIVLKRKRLSNHPLTLRNAAHAEAASALSNPTMATDVRGAAIQCSLILRRYLSFAAGDPALFETHEEFIARHDALQNLSASARSAAGDGFTRLAGLKYAFDLPPVAAVDVITESRALLETLHHGFTK